MSDSWNVTYASALEPFTEALASLKQPGSYYASGVIEAAPPLLEVKDFGIVAFPVPEAQAKALVTHAEKAPYGRGDATLVDESVRKVRQKIPINEVFFQPNDILVPALEQLATGPHKVSSETAVILWQYCAEFLLHRSETPPAPPTNWKLPLTERQLKGLRADIKAFALDPDQQKLRFRVRKELRQEIHRIIESKNLDMTHVTERKGSPHTLVCRKTRAYYKRAIEQYTKDVSAMRVLLKIPTAQTPALAPLATRLTAAVR